MGPLRDWGLIKEKAMTMRWQLYWGTLWQVCIVWGREPSQQAHVGLLLRRGGGQWNSQERGG